MRFLLSFLLIVLLGFIAGIFLPWWSIAIVAFLVALLLPQSLARSFLAGFSGIFFLWAFVALWIDLKNESVLSVKIAELFPLQGSTMLLIFITALVGAVVAGFAAMSGSSLRLLKRNT
jgi:hypothetical protein